MAAHRSLSVVVPVYNGAGTVVGLADRLAPVLEGLAAAYELILVDDGSDDSSWDLIRELAEREPWIRGFRLMRNYGQHNALLCGIRHASSEVIVTMDDDLQNPPEELPKLVARLEDGFDVVYGAPKQQQHGFWRNAASNLTKLALRNMMGAHTARRVSAFRAFRTHLREAFSTYQGPFVSIDVLLTWSTTRFASVPVRHDPRGEGESNYTFRKLVRHALNLITGFSVLPLRIASLIGFAFTLFGLAVLAYVLGNVLIAGRVVPGFAFLASIIAIFAGAQLFALGIVGEYMARMHFRLMDKPPYAVHEQTRSDPTTVEPRKDRVEAV